MYVGKLLGISLVGGAAVKYGSLLSSIPFEPSAGLALTMIALPPVLMSVYFAVNGGGDKKVDS